jgi:mRNA interferase RelE/StbE
MRYTIEFTASALREFRALDRHVQRRISTKIETLRNDPFPAGVRKFQGKADHWRIRLGDYRVIYRIEKQHVIIVVSANWHRREVYR